MAKEAEVILSLDVKEDEDSVITRLCREDNKKELLRKIDMLRMYISLLVSTITTSKFDQLAEKPSKLLYYNNIVTFEDIPYKQAISCRNLHQVEPIQCVKFQRNSKIVFDMSNTDIVTMNDTYAVEILIDSDGHVKLGRWALPPCIDIHEILLQHPLDNLNNIKHFLKTCKHYIDCYVQRVQQLEELKYLFSEIENTQIYHNSNITLLEITMSQVEDIKTDEFHEAVVYLYYNLTDTNPYKLSTDTNNIETPPLVLLKRLNAYFEPFLKKNLILAFLQISDSKTEFVWEKIITNDNEHDVNIYEESVESECKQYLEYFLCRGDKQEIDHEHDERI